MPTNIFLVRHGQTDWNVQRRIQGSVDTPLNNLGRTQAELTAAALATHTFDRIVSSHLERAAFTANAIANEHGLPVDLDARLAERAHGRYEGSTFPEVAAAVGLENADHFFQNSPELEAWSAVTERMFVALQHVVDTTQGGTAVVVSHGGAIKAVVSAIQSVHHRSLPGLGNCSITRLSYDDGWNVVDFNRVDHIPEDLR